MAKFLVPPHGSCVIKCRVCKGLYVPERINDGFAEKCPFCSCDYNNYKDSIPVWKYNLIRFFRSGANVEDIEDGHVKFDEPEVKDEPKKEKKSEKSKTYTATTSSTYTIDAPLSLQKPAKYLNAPKEDEYAYEMVVMDRNTSKAEKYYFFGFVDTMMDMPFAENMPYKTSVYYVRSRKKFAATNGVLWTFDNDIDRFMTGSKREEFLIQAECEEARRKKTTRLLLKEPRTCIY